MTDYMKQDGFYENVEKIGVMPVVVLEKLEDAVPMGNALTKGGLPAAEVTFRTSAAADCIHAMATKCPDVLVGAGTVLNLDQAKRAVDAGAKFIVSPGFDLEVVDWCLANKIDVIPAGVTPTEPWSTGASRSPSSSLQAFTVASRPSTHWLRCLLGTASCLPVASTPITSAIISATRRLSLLVARGW